MFLLILFSNRRSLVVLNLFSNWRILVGASRCVCSYFLRCFVSAFALLSGSPNPKAISGSLVVGGVGEVVVVRVRVFDVGFGWKVKLVKIVINRAGVLCCSNPDSLSSLPLSSRLSLLPQAFQLDQGSFMAPPPPLHYFE